MKSILFTKGGKAQHLYTIDGPIKEHYGTVCFGYFNMSCMDTLKSWSSTVGILNLNSGWDFYTGLDHESWISPQERVEKKFDLAIHLYEEPSGFRTISL